MTRWTRATAGYVPLLAALAGALSATGCAKSGRDDKPIVGRPIVVARGWHYAGTPLSGAKATTMPTSNVDAARALAVTVTVDGVNQIPNGGTPLGASVRLVTSTVGSRPMLGVPKMLAGGRLYPKENNPAQGDSAEMAAWRGALPDGVTAAFELADANDIDPANGEPRRALRVEVYRPTGKGRTDVEIALAVRDWVTDDTAAVADGTPGGTTAAAAAVPVPGRERVIFATSAVTDGGLTVGVPFELGTSPDSPRALLLRIDVADPDPSPEHAAATEACALDLVEFARRAVAASSLADAASPEWPGLDGALAALANDPGRRRAAAVFLAERTAARVSGDLALVGDDAFLARFAEAVGKSVATTGPLSPADLGWMLDRSSLDVLAEPLAAGTLPLELAGIITRVAGEAGRHADSFTEVVRAASGWADLDARLVAENYIYLEDSSPGARVRAYDWLRARGAAPAGYDPLGDRRDRRAAIERAVTAAATQPAPSAGTAGATGATAGGGQP